MTTWLSTIFIGGVLGVCGFFLLFTYLGFPLALAVLTSFFSKKFSSQSKIPMNVQVIISCFNEGAAIARRITNALREASSVGDYQVMVILDGPTDNSVEVVREMAAAHDKVNVFYLEKNVGKNRALNQAFSAGAFTGDLLCFTDADVEFAPGALSEAVKLFEDPEVGLVGGNISYWLDEKSAHRAEGLYWRLENFLRESEGDLGLLVSCPGVFIMMRRELFEPLPPDANTDFAMPLSILAQGYETRFGRHAVVYSAFPADGDAVLKRRKRTIIRALTTIAAYKHRLSWKVRLILFWHKTARFYLLPVQGAVFVSNLILASTSPYPLWAILFLAQLGFYGAALLGWVADRLHLKIPWVHLSYHFTLQHAMAFAGVIAFHRGQRVCKWTPPR